MQKWNKIPRGSRITLKKDTEFNGFDGPFILKQGKYYIVGFWANACGLSQKKKDVYRSTSERFIPAISLPKFEEVTK